MSIYNLENSKNQVSISGDVVFPDGITLSKTENGEESSAAPLVYYQTITENNIELYDDQGQQVGSLTHTYTRLGQQVFVSYSNVTFTTNDDTQYVATQAGDIPDGYRLNQDTCAGTAFWTHDGDNHIISSIDVRSDDSVAFYSYDVDFPGSETFNPGTNGTHMSFTYTVDN